MGVRAQIAKAVRDAENKRDIHAVTGIDPATLTRIANGERMASGEAIDRLAAYFRLELQPVRSVANRAAKRGK
jgi:uncharacterized protein YerC